MKPLSGGLDSELIWERKDRIAREYALRAGEDVFATLRYESQFGTAATGESSDGRWSFDRRGFFHPRVLVRGVGSSSDAVTVTLPWLGWQGGIGRVQPTDGGPLRWAPASLFLGVEYLLTTEDGHTLLRFQRRVLKSPRTQQIPKAQLQVDPAARSLPQLSVLALLGFYLMAP
jgi:hypothetical protein